jgi:hypothetical protein
VPVTQNTDAQKKKLWLVLILRRVPLEKKTKNKAPKMKSKAPAAVTWCRCMSLHLTLFLASRLFFPSAATRYYLLSFISAASNEFLSSQVLLSGFFFASFLHSLIVQLA